MKVNLPIFKDEKAKDVVTYCSWRWDVAIFGQSGWDDQYLLPYIFHSLQGFLGDLSKSMGEDATFSDILQMLNEHYGVVMTFDALSKGPSSLSRDWGECSRVQDAPFPGGPDTPVRVLRENPARTLRRDEAWSCL